MSKITEAWKADVGKRIPTPGRDYGPRGITLLKRSASHALILWPGHSFWSGRGLMGYHPKTFLVVNRQGEIVMEFAPSEFGEGGKK